jgi:hypothetical protein
VGTVSETVPSQADVVANVATTDNSGPEQPAALAAALPLQAVLLPSHAPDVLSYAVAVTIPDADGPPSATSSIPASLTVGVGGWSSPPVVATADQGSSFVVRPPASAVYGVGPNGFRIAAGRSTNRGTDVAGNASLAIEVVPAVNLSSSSVPGENSTGGEPTVPAQMRTVFADQASAHDAVLAGEIAASASEASWLSDVAHARGRRNSAGDLESLTDAVDDALAAHDTHNFTNWPAAGPSCRD